MKRADSCSGWEEAGAVLIKGRCPRYAFFCAAILFYGNVCICVYYNMNSGDIIKRLKCDGWYEVARRGSHVQFRHAVNKGRVTVPHPKKDLPADTVKALKSRLA